MHALAECCFSTYKKVALAATAFLLGDCLPLTDENEATSEEEGVSTRAHAPIGSKKTMGKARRFKRQQEVIKRKEERKLERRNGKGWEGMRIASANLGYM